MILYLFIIIGLVFLTILLSFSTTGLTNSKKLNLKRKIITLASVSVIATFLYFNLSNYWIGNSILEKIKIYTNIKNRNANEIAVVREVMFNLEKELKKTPNNLEKIIELAETKFILGYFEDALILYKRARRLTPNSVNIMKAEAQIRVLLENQILSKETIDLLKNILSIEKENVLALYILGNYEYKNKNFIKANSMFQTLKRLLNPNTQEYNEIKTKISEMEKMK